ncbi:hypothetical protein CO180_00195 [candidate division WWE3 bacterium CG_4_9_14_3_um_filter_41_6]|uniref:Uncharacterized protein n=1 Tax=candidate division WWE3 bacterium CG_4_10_14_0_2_um_filter_41_14 TaxID=1975072 RepID=A0A2M7THN4_UNCKA|nr:MAG: hypothetical protein COY32_04605 [candidate division WWE3 bacterium CG_4_10_14_0_2_um_filter_41_14]PJA39653.1 MAG: hypothetical protein CO180_00195 [candidate division WWE3 bacterium CG_4_9_14_3_um_filter_41_6]
MCFLIDQKGTVVTELEFRSLDNKDLACVACDFFAATGTQATTDVWVISVEEGKGFQYYLRYPGTDPRDLELCRRVESEQLAVALAHAYHILRGDHGPVNYYAQYLDNLLYSRSTVTEFDYWVNSFFARVVRMLSQGNPSELLLAIARSINEDSFSGARALCWQTDKLERFRDDLYILLWWGIKDHPWAALMRMQRQRALLK